MKSPEFDFDRHYQQAKSDLGALSNYVNELIRLRKERLELLETIKELRYEITCLRNRE